MFRWAHRDSREPIDRLTFLHHGGILHCGFVAIEVIFAPAIDAGETEHRLIQLPLTNQLFCDDIVLFGFDVLDKKSTIDERIDRWSSTNRKFRRSPTFWNHFESLHPSDGRTARCVDLAWKSALSDRMCSSRSCSPACRDVVLCPTRRGLLRWYSHLFEMPIRKATNNIKRRQKKWRDVLIEVERTSTVGYSGLIPSSHRM